MKRSHAVVAILAAATVGGTAYSMMPSERCERSDGGAALDPSSPGCRGGSSGSGWHSSRSYFGSYGGDNSASSANASTTSAPSSGTQRGGFGGFFSSLGSRIAASVRA